MKLQQTNSTSYDIDSEWAEHTTNRIIREMREIYVLNEGQIDEGIKEFLQKGAAKVKNAVAKSGKAGKEATATINAHVAKKMQVDMPEAFAKLKQFAGNHKTATAVIAVVGASLMAMEPAAASQAMDAVSNMGIDQVADQIGGGGGGGGGKQMIIDILKSAQANGADMDQVNQGLRSVEVHGMNVEDFANKVVELSAKSKDPDSFIAAGREKIINALRDIQGGVADADMQSEPTVTTKQYTRQDMDPEMAKRLRGG